MNVAVDFGGESRQNSAVDERDWSRVFEGWMW